MASQARGPEPAAALQPDGGARSRRASPPRSPWAAHRHCWHRRRRCRAAANRRLPCHPSHPRTSPTQDNPVLAGSFRSRGTLGDITSAGFVRGLQAPAPCLCRSCRPRRPRPWAAAPPACHPPPYTRRTCPRCPAMSCCTTLSDARSYMPAARRGCAAARCRLECVFCHACSVAPAGGSCCAATKQLLCRDQMAAPNPPLACRCFCATGRTRRASSRAPPRPPSRTARPWPSR